MPEKFLTISQHKSNISTYHSRRDCPRVKDPDKLRPRPKRYIEYHDLSPCQYCHDD